MGPLKLPGPQASALATLSSITPLDDCSGTCKTDSDKKVCSY